MSDYVTPSRGHDATWMLQHVQVGNDLHLRDGRTRYARLGHGDRGRDFSVPVTTTDEIADATITVRRLAARGGHDEGAITEVLEALGLIPTTRCPGSRRIPRPEKRTA
ncbi:hypothetical protein [Streptosporangium saharense]|uniref:hypothetical protein n=1 Tax=Streptosporangium saharense TaxID=1706840 RepID=UPI0034243860